MIGSLAMSINPKTLPRPTPETRHFWEGAKLGELRLQQCDACTHVYFPPRPFCPECASRQVSVVRASGRATLYSYVINHRLPKWIDAPYAIAVVQLEEGPRMMTNILGVPQTPEALVLDMPLEVVFESVSADIALPKFRPARGGAR
mgnify:FL=1|jgi:uncharacterized OB-fold protein